MALNPPKNRLNGNKRGDGEALVPFESVQEFHRRITSAIEAVQTGIWEAGVHEILDHATDFGIRRDRGVQTLVLKTSRKSAYMRLGWETLMGSSEADHRRFDEAIRSAIVELS